MIKQFFFKQFCLACHLLALSLNVRGQSGPGSNATEVVLCIPKSSSITEALPSDCLVSYPGHSWGWSYPSSEMQSVYSKAPAECSGKNCRRKKNYLKKKNKNNKKSLFVWVYSISVFVGYLMPNPFLYK